MSKVSGLEATARISGLEDTVAPPSGLEATAAPQPALDATLAASSDDLSASASSGSSVTRGESIDHFIVIDQIGAGGMGVVLSAYDPDLDRKVAIKLLRSDDGSEAHRARLVREAQAMAKLSHPNVVTVHEVGTVGDRVFVAMEFVDGGTLRQRTEGAALGWRERLDLYVQAGRGLAAAHRAGLVHRDFKPDNALVTRDGRVQVTDFGLVGLHGEAKRMTADTSAPADLTRTGSIMGTPAYMAPEQHAGEAVDARADQFAFCVALHEALYGARPFAGKSYDELAGNVLAGRFAPIPKVDVPAWLRAVLQRGMATDPAKRYASMDELLVALAYERRQRRARIAAVASAFVVTIAVGGVAVATSRTEDAGPAPCEGAEELLAGVWDANVKSTMRGAFERAGLPYAAEAFDRVAASLDRYASAWAGHRVEACKATLRGEQSETLLDKRMYCLDGQLGQVRELTRQLGTADAKLVGRAVELTAALPQLAACGDAEALMASYPLPSDPVKREQVRQLQTRVKQVGMLHTTGRYAEANQLAPDVVAEARVVAHVPLLAEVLYDHAATLRLAGASDLAKHTFREAAAAAASARDDVRVANSYASLYHMLANEQGRRDEATAMQPFMENAFLRADNVEARGLQLDLAGLRARNAGKFDEAQQHWRALIGLFGQRDDNAARLKVVNAHFNIGLTLRDAGKLDAALDEIGLAERLATEAFGAKSPITLKGTSAIGGTLLVKGDVAGAIPILERARAGQQAALGTKHQDVAETLTLLGVALQGQGAVDRAVEMFEAARAGYLATFGPDSAQLAFPLANLGNIALDRGEVAKAKSHYLDAQRIWEKQLGPRHPLIGQLVATIAHCEALLGEDAAATQHFERGLAILGAIEPKTAIYAVALSNQAAAFSRRGQHDRARADSTRAVDIMRKLQAGSPDALSIELTHAGILVAAGDHRSARPILEKIVEPLRASKNKPKTAEAERLLGEVLGR